MIPRFHQSARPTDSHCGGGIEPMSRDDALAWRLTRERHEQYYPIPTRDEACAVQASRRQTRLHGIRSALAGCAGRFRPTIKGSVR